MPRKPIKFVMVLGCVGWGVFGGGDGAKGGGVVVTGEQGGGRRGVNS